MLILFQIDYVDNFLHSLHDPTTPGNPILQCIYELLNVQISVARVDYTNALVSLEIKWHCKGLPQHKVMCWYVVRTNRRCKLGTCIIAL